MPKRTISIQTPAEVFIKHKQLVISQDSREAKIPLEDIWVLILESRHVQITSAALSSLSSEGIGVIFCDEKHMPNGLLLPLGAHSRHAGIVENQLTLSKPFQKRLWQRIVQQKIENQAKVLRLLGFSWESVYEYRNQVQSGDASNREAVAASAYFRELIPQGGRRESQYSASLDYGYAIIRGGVARALVSGGWLVSRGIHHENNLNAFNLADDFIEPFRPVVDLLVISDDMRSLSPETKHKLASVFEFAMSMGGEKVSVQQAIQFMIYSFKKSVLAQDVTLFKTPQLLELEALGYE